jgi:hypothetical protein
MRVPEMRALEMRAPEIRLDSHRIHHCLTQITVLSLKKHCASPP